MRHLIHFTGIFIIIGIFLIGCDAVVDNESVLTKPSSTGLGGMATIQSASNTSTVWFQDFSEDTDDWLGFPTGSQIFLNGDGTATVLGASFDCPGYVQDRGINPCYGGAFSQFGGYRTEWPGTWIAELDVYLDPITEDFIDGRWGFDYIVAASRTNGVHLRDFVFHVGIVDGIGLLVNGSNNADRYTNPFKLQNDNNGNYFQVNDTGWYTLQHVFYDNEGFLNVDLNLIKDGQVLWTATRVTTDVIGGEDGVVGGNRYAWFSHVDSNNDGIIIDNHRLSIEIQDPQNIDDCKKGGWQQYGFSNQGRCIQFVNTGKDSRK